MQKYLKELVEISGISGKEEKVMQFIKKNIQDKVDSVSVDNVGNLIAFKKGNDSSKKIMFAAHMDEVGLMVTKIYDDGTLGVAQVGGVDPRVLKAQRLKINDEIVAILNSTPIHLDHNLTAVTGYDSIKAYAGFKNKDEAKLKVKIGDMVTFDVKYYENNEYAVCKAFDDRCGCSAMMDLIDFFDLESKKPFYDTYFAFVVQEETGLRGSGVAGFSIQPDVAVILEGTTAGDNPELEKTSWATHLGDGAVLTFMHSGVVLDKRIFEYLVETSKKNNIKHQFKMRTAGGTDAARLTRTVDGIPCAVISTPCRYIHSANSIINKNDYNSVVELIKIISVEGRILK